MKMTASRLVSHYRCKFLQHVQYVVKEPLPLFGIHRRFGIVVHAAREAYEKHGRRLEIGLEVLHERGKDLPPEAVSEAQNMLRWRHERQEERGGRPFLIEGSLSTSVAGHRLDVRMDRLDELADGQLLLSEYKTGRRVDLDVVQAQLKILSFVVWSVLGRAPTFWEVELLRALRVITLPAETEGPTLERFTADLARSVARGDKEPDPVDPAFCKRCPAKAYCPRMTKRPKPFTRRPAKLEHQLTLF